MTRRAAALALALAALVTACAPARADVWGYIDARGVAHFASERLDERYELYWRGGQSFDTSQGIAPSAPELLPETPRPVAVPSRSASRLLAYFEVSPVYKQVRGLLRSAAADHNLDQALLQALIATESGFDPAAVSPKGAVGLMQVMPATAMRYGLVHDARRPVDKQLADPATNIRIGARYLRDLLNLFTGDLTLALAAYNAGEGAVQRYGNRIPPYRETQNYVQTVLQLYELLQPPPSLRPVPAPPAVPPRVRMELGGPLAGGARGRANMPPPLAGTGTP